MINVGVEGKRETDESVGNVLITEVPVNADNNDNHDQAPVETRTSEDEDVLFEINPAFETSPSSYVENDLQSSLFASTLEDARDREMVS